MPKKPKQRPVGSGLHPTLLPAGVLFIAGTEAADEAISRGVFGTLKEELDLVQRVKPDTPCFMYIVPEETLHSVFLARDWGGYNLVPDYQPDPKVRGLSAAPAQVLVYPWWDCVNPLQGRHLQSILGPADLTKRVVHALTKPQVDALLMAFSELNPGVESRHLLGSNPIACHYGPSPTYWTSDDFNAAGPGSGGPHSPRTLGDDGFGGVLPPDSCRAASPLGIGPHGALNALMEHTRRLDQAMPDGLILPPDQAMPIMLPHGGGGYGGNAPWRIPGETTAVPEPRHVVTQDPHVTLQGGELMRSVLCYATGAYNPDCLDGEADGSKLEVRVADGLPEDIDEMVYGGAAEGHLSNRGAFGNPHPIMWDAEHEAAMGNVIRSRCSDLPGVRWQNPWNADGDPINPEPAEGHPSLRYPHPGLPGPFAPPTVPFPAFALHTPSGPTTVQLADIPGSVATGTAPTLTDVFAYLDLRDLGDSVDFVYLYDVPTQRQDAQARLVVHARLPEAATQLHCHLKAWHVGGRKAGPATFRTGVGLFELHKRHRKRALILEGPPSCYDFRSYDFRSRGHSPVPIEFFAWPGQGMEPPVFEAAGIYLKPPGKSPAPLPNAATAPQSNSRKRTGTGTALPEEPRRAKTPVKSGGPKSRERPSAPAPPASTALLTTRKRKATAPALPPSAKTPAKGREGEAVSTQAFLPPVASPPSQETLGAGPSKKPRRAPIVWAPLDESDRRTGLKIRVIDAGKPGTGVEPAPKAGKATVSKGNESCAMGVRSVEVAGALPEGRPPTPPRHPLAPGPQGNRKRGPTPASPPGVKRAKTPALSGEDLGVGSAAPPIASAPSKDDGGARRKPGKDPIVWIPQEDPSPSATLRSRVKHAVAAQECAAKQLLAAQQRGEEATSLAMRAADEKARALKAQVELKPPDLRKLENVSPRLGSDQDEDKRPPTAALQKLECVRPPLSAHQEGEGKKSSVNAPASAAPFRANTRAAASQATPSANGNATSLPAIEGCPDSLPAANGTTSLHVTASTAIPSANGHAGALPGIKGGPGSLPETNGAGVDGLAARPETGLQLEGVTPLAVAERKVLPPSEAADAGEGFPDSEEAPECEFGGDFIALE